MFKSLSQRFSFIASILVASLMASCAPLANAGGAMSDYLENKITDHVFRGQTYVAPTRIYVALYTTPCNDAGPGAEVSGGAYARGSLTTTMVNWAGTQSAESQAASFGTSGKTSNNSAISFLTPTAAWGTVTHVGLMDALTGGNMLVCATLILPKSIASGDLVSFRPGTLFNILD